MVSEKFRRQLEQEAQKWQSENLIEPTFYELLAQRYQFATLPQEASSRFVYIIISLGAVLLGLGVMTFVAANWQEWSRVTKIIILLGSFLSVNIVGFYFSRQNSNPVLRLLGYFLLLLGGLLLGANLGLMSQLFQQTGEAYQLFLIWGLGLTAMAYSLRLTSLGVLSLILVGSGYLVGWEFLQSDMTLQYMPLIALVVFVPLAYWCASGTIFTLNALLLVFTLIIVGSRINYPLFGFILPSALLWGYGNLPRTDDLTISFGKTARFLALLVLGIALYVFSFKWENYTFSRPSYFDEVWFSLVVNAIILCLATGWCYLKIGNPFVRSEFSLGWVNKATVSLVLILCGLTFVNYHTQTINTLLVSNILLFLLAIGLIQDGLVKNERLAFWGGMILLVLQVISRTLEYDTQLLLKSVVLLLCGLGVMLAGFLFERRLRS